MKKAKAWWSAITTKTKRELCKEFFGNPYFINTCNPAERDNYTARLFEWHTDNEKRIRRQSESMCKWLKTQSVNVKSSFGDDTNKKLNYGIDLYFHVISNGKTVLKTKDPILAIKKYESL